MSKPKPCPFCGGKPTIRIDDGGVSAKYGNIYYVRCSNRFCRVKPKTVVTPTLEQCIRIWNERSST